MSQSNPNPTPNVTVADAMALAETAYTTSIVNLLIGIVLIGLVTFAIMRIQATRTELHNVTNDLKATIGRVIREMNVINGKKYTVDREQSQKIGQLTRTSI